MKTTPRRLPIMSFLVLYALPLMAVVATRCIAPHDLASDPPRPPLHAQERYYMPNPQITKGGSAVNVPMTTGGNGPGGTSAAYTGVACFQVVDSSGTIVVPKTNLPTAGTPVTVGNFTFANLGTSPTFIGGFPFTNLSIQASSGATAGVGYALEETTAPGTAYAPFDIVTGSPVAKVVNGLKHFPAAQSVDRLRVSGHSPHAPILTLRHGATLGALTALTGVPVGTVDAADPTLWHWDVPLSPAVSDALFLATLSSAAGTADPVDASDYRAYYLGAEVGGGPVPATPTGLAGLAGSGQATLSWDASTDTSVLGYGVTQDGAAISAAGATLAGGRYTLVVTGLTNSTPYTFRVADFNSNGYSPYSAPVTVTPGSTATALTIAITAPPTGSTLQGVIPVTAQVDGGTGGVAKVELYVAGVLVDTETAVATMPDLYTLLWDSRPSANGSYTVTAKAYDRATPTPHTASASITLTASNPSGLDTSYWYGAPDTPGAGKSIREFLGTCDIVPTDDPRELRQIIMGYRTGGASGGFEANYTTIPINEQQAVTGSHSAIALAVKMAALSVVSTFTFAGNVRKVVPAADPAKCLLWTTDGKVWLFDGTSTPTLHLDTSTILTSGETLNDICVSQGRTFLAISGGATPVPNRLYEFDPASADESYSLYVLPSAPNALCAVGGSLYIGTQAGKVHTLSATGALKILVGATTALPNPVVGLYPLALSRTNTTPGVGIALSDGSVWDIDATEATHGARIVFVPNGTTETATNCAAVVGTTRYLGTGTGGDLMALGGVLSAYAAVFTAPAAIVAAAAFGNTVYFAVSGDPRLWALTTTPSVHTLAYSPVIDSLAATQITALYTLGSVLVIGTSGGANNLFEYQAPALDPNAVYGRSIKRPGLTVTEFA